MSVVVNTKSAWSGIQIFLLTSIVSKLVKSRAVNNEIDRYRSQTSQNAANIEKRYSQLALVLNRIRQ